MSSARSTRALRGLVAAGIATFVALLSHVAGGGSMPGALGVVVPLVLSAVVCVLLAGQRLSLVRLTISVAVSQLLFHTLFVLGAAQGVGSVATSTGHAGHAAPVPLDAAVVPLAHGSHAGSAMWIAHVVAGILTIAALHRAESLLSTAAAVKEFVLRALVPVAMTVLAAPAGPARVVRRADVSLPRALGVFSAVTALRGPPAVSFL